MKKTKKLLIFLILTFSYSITYAQDMLQQNIHQFITSSTGYRSPSPNNSDSLETILAVYGLIIGVYVLYWFRQKT
ncbi:MAG: hypothetical protein RLZ75_151 [Pseudomonadota bacterium]|jgi:hypothetical protein